MSDIFSGLIRELKFKLSDTTLTSDINQTLSNLLSQTNKVHKTVTAVSKVANTALIRSTNPSLALEGLSDVVISAIQNGQTILWNGTDWVNGSAGLSLTTGGQGGMIGPNLGDLFALYSPSSYLTAGILSGTVNQVTAFQFKLPYTISISRISVNVRTAAAGKIACFGIYSASRAKLLESGGLSTTSTGAVHATITPVMLSPGIYYLAQSSDSTSAAVDGIQPATVAGINMLNALSVKVGQSPNLTVAGVMPASLGTLVADSVYPSVACPLFEV